MTPEEAFKEALVIDLHDPHRRTVTTLAVLIVTTKLNHLGPGPVRGVAREVADNPITERERSLMNLAAGVALVINGRQVDWAVGDAIATELAQMKGYI